MKKTLSLLAASVVVLSAQAQPFSPTLGDGATLDQQVIGDTNATADRTNSTSTQLGNSANNNGASMANNVDTRDQNTNNVQGGAATGGAAIGNQSDNKSQVGNVGASNGNQSLDGRSQVGNTSSNSGGNVLGGATSGGNTLSNGSSSGGNTTTSQGGTGVGVGLGGDGGKGGTGGTASSNGTNLGINGQQQGIDRSGNSANTNANTAAQGQGQGQQQANNGTNAQGQTSANTNTAGGNTGGNSANRNTQNTAQSTSAGNGAGAGAGSNNRTALSVDASDRSENSYKSLAVAHAPIVHGPAAPAIPIANGWFAPSQCGPRHSIVKTGFEGRHMGLVFDSTFKQGDDYSVTPLEEPFIRKNGYLIGHLVNEYVAVVGTSSAKSLSAQGFGSNQSGGGAGGATSGAHQQIVVRVTIRDCVMQEKAPAPAIIVQETIRTETMPLPPLPKADRN